MRVVAPLALVLFAFPSCPSAATDARAGTTPFRLMSEGRVVVPVMLNGVGPFPLLLDTGSSHSTISEDLAQVVGASPVARTVVTSPTGNDLRAVVRVDRLDLGPVTARGLLPSIVPRKSIDEHGTIQGIVGQDVLAQHRYTIEFGNRRIVWHGDQAVPSEAHSELGLDFERGRFLVELPQASGILRLVPDSGAGALVLFLPPGRLLSSLGLAPVPGIVELATLTARRDLRQVMVRELRVGRATVRDWPAAIVERPEPDTSEGDGLLPLHVFERVTFDGPGRRLLIFH
jgi:hypothetical protein